MIQGVEDPCEGARVRRCQVRRRQAGPYDPAMDIRQVAVVCALCALCALVACRGAEEPVADAPRSTVVSVATVRKGELRDVANASGTIVPSSVADVTIYAPELADIVELPKKVDDPVQTGDVLVRFDIPSVNQEAAMLQLQVIEAQARLDRAQAELTRQTSLFERGITSRNAYDESRLEHSAAESALSAARSRVDSARPTQDRSIVRATFPGVVAELWHEEGDTVRPDTNDPIIRVVDPTKVQVSLQLPVVQLARVVAGQTAIVRAIAGVADEEAVVASKVQSVDPTAPTGEVRLNFVNPATLTVDTPVSVEILLERRPDALIVPVQAIARDDFGSFVMVADESGLARRRDVQVGLVAGQLAQIVNGVNDGERVILTSPADLVDGEPIAIAR
jgi:RND family efflux transporter MFP subunit